MIDRKVVSDNGVIIPKMALYYLYQKCDEIGKFRISARIDREK